MLVALFFFFRDGERMSDRVRELLPMAPAHKQVIFTRLYDTLTAVVQGMVLTAVAQGTLAGIGYWLIADLPFALFLGVPDRARLVPAARRTGAHLGRRRDLPPRDRRGRPRASAWRSGAASLVSTVDNVIKTLVIGGRARLPTFLLLFALLGGLKVYGFLGVFLAPVILAILLAFTDIYRELYALRSSADALRLCRAVPAAAR